jgi:hypothetical protein
MLSYMKPVYILNTIMNYRMEFKHTRIQGKFEGLPLGILLNSAYLKLMGILSKHIKLTLP